MPHLVQSLRVRWWMLREEGITNACRSVAYPLHLRVGRVVNAAGGGHYFRRVFQPLRQSRNGRVSFVKVEFQFLDLISQCVFTHVVHVHLNPRCTDMECSNPLPAAPSALSPSPRSAGTSTYRSWPIQTSPPAPTGAPDDPAPRSGAQSPSRSRLGELRQSHAIRNRGSLLYTSARGASMRCNDAPSWDFRGRSTNSTIRASFPVRGNSI